MMSAMIAAALAVSLNGSFSVGTSYAKWTESSLVVGNASFERTYESRGGVLRTVRFGLVGQKPFVSADSVTNAVTPLSVSCEKRRFSPVTHEALVVSVVLNGRATEYAVFEDVPGVVVTADGISPSALTRYPKDYQERCSVAWNMVPMCRSDSDVLSYASQSLAFTVYTVLDQTDIRDNLLSCETTTGPGHELPALIRASALDVRDRFSGLGAVFLRMAPMPASRPSDAADFFFDSNHVPMKSVAFANGYPVAELVYDRGEAGRIAALRKIQRAYRPYRAGRDGLFLSNTWGGGNRDTRINASFLMREIAAAEELGVDVIQIDDGWQKGRTANSGKSGAKGVWNGFWASDPMFWTPDRERFPAGLGPLASAARDRGLRFGLWFAPDSTDQAKNWERDADTLLAFYRDFGMTHFKLDAMKLHSPEAFANNRRMFDKMLADSCGAMSFDLDCTAETRPGFLGLVDVGTMFVENRYAIDSYSPWMTLSSLWQLAHVIDPVRLRVEVVNPDVHPEKIESTLPYAAARWPKDAAFAIAMVASPLAWMELSEISSERMQAMRPLVAAWRRERSRLHAGTTFPVGGRPDGFAWTGFVTRSEDRTGGYAILFRELNESPLFRLDLRPYLAEGNWRVRVLGGRGSAEVRDGGLVVDVSERLDYVWLKLEPADIGGSEQKGN